MTLGRIFGGYAFATALANILEDFDQGEFEFSNAVALIGTAASLIPGPHTAVIAPLMALYPVASDFGEYLANEGTLDPLFDLMLHQPDVELTWNDWEFAANATYVEAPSFGHAESITSPLILDLDRDGIETIHANTGVQFDHDADQFAERTGWASSDDGILAIDLNENGLIDDGSELFGNHSTLTSGSKAANGFEALAEYDSNQDGLIDSFDIDFSRLKVWRDLNYDGQSQAFELISLEEAGISALSTAYQTSNDRQQGNLLREIGSLTYTDGSEGALTDVWFETNRTLSEYKHTASIPDNINALPNIHGFGTVANLQQAMMNDERLATLVKEFSTNTDSTARHQSVDDIIYQWAGVADVDPYSRDPSKVYGHVMDARQLEALEAFTGEGYNGIWCWGENDPNPHGRAAPVLIAQYHSFRNYIEGQLNAQTHLAEAFNLIGVAFNGHTKMFEPDAEPFTDYLEQLIKDADLSAITQITHTLKQLSYGSSSYEQLWDGLKADETLSSWLTDDHVVGTDQAETLTGSSEDDFLLGNQGDDRLIGGAGNDIYSFNLGDGHDWIYDTSGEDRLILGKGIQLDQILWDRSISDITLHMLDENGSLTGDSIQLSNVFDFDGSLREGVLEQVIFDDGTTLDVSSQLAHIRTPATKMDDTLFGTHINDQLKGERGDDLIYGGAGNDTYFFQRGDGYDTLIEHSGVDRIIFSAGIALEHLKISRVGENGEDILIDILDPEKTESGDKIRISQAYQNGIVTSNQIEQIVITNNDGSETGYTLFDLSKSFFATEGHDHIFGFESDDIISGHDGDDQIEGAGGDDTLIGGSGNDTLNAGSGNDFIEGGIGHDQLQGGLGSDVYLFSQGHGHDVITNKDTESIDTLHFDASIHPKRVIIERLGDDLMVRTSLTDDSVKITDFFEGDQIAAGTINQITFETGMRLDLNSIVEQTMRATQGDDHIQGLASADIIDGLSGNDELVGGRGDDHIYGGQGHDTLQGQDGNDYLIGEQGNDQLLGGAGHDVLEGGNAQDQLYGGAGHDTLSGGNGDDQLWGGANNDQLFADKGNDTLNGGQGDDELFGGRGDDTYIINSDHGHDVINDSAGFDTLKLTDTHWKDINIEILKSHLLVTTSTSNQSIKIENWRKGAIDRIETSDGWAEMPNIEKMVEAMTIFDAMNEDEATAEDRTALNRTLATQWHSNE